MLLVSVLVFAITRARVPMPKSARTFIERCRVFHDALGGAELEPQPESMRVGPVGLNLPA